MVDILEFLRWVLKAILFVLSNDETGIYIKWILKPAKSMDVLCRTWGVFHDLWDEARVTGAHICNRTEAGFVFSMEISQAEWAPLFFHAFHDYLKQHEAFNPDGNNIGT